MSHSNNGSKPKQPADSGEKQRIPTPTGGLTRAEKMKEESTTGPKKGRS